MKGPPAVLVAKSSATHCRPWEDGAEHMCAVARTHSAMIKFRPHDDEYDKVRSRLVGLARRAVTGRRRQVFGTKFLVPCEENREFVGREGVLSKVKTLLGFGQRPGISERRSRVALQGLGGVGKTQIALAYVYLLQDACPNVSMFWIHASSAERFRQSLMFLAAECEITGCDDPKNDVLLLVKYWLGRKGNGPWVMILDNADDAELFFGRLGQASDGKEETFGQFLPKYRHGTLLFTTRNKEAGVKLARVGPLLNVNRIADAKSRNLLSKILQDISATDNNPSILSSRLKHLPLTITQAAASIQTKNITIPAYIDLLDESDQTLIDLLYEEFETIGQNSETTRAVAQT